MTSSQRGLAEQVRAGECETPESQVAIKRTVCSTIVASPRYHLRKRAVREMKDPGHHVPVGERSLMTEFPDQNRATRTCDECGSTYFVDASKMDALCPECAHHLYRHPNCDHAFVDGRCRHCAWDGSRSKYIRDLIAGRRA